MQLQHIHTLTQIFKNDSTFNRHIPCVCHSLTRIGGFGIWDWFVAENKSGPFIPSRCLWRFQKHLNQSIFWGRGRGAKRPPSFGKEPQDSPAARAAFCSGGGERRASPPTCGEQRGKHQQPSGGRARQRRGGAERGGDRTKGKKGREGGRKGGKKEAAEGAGRVEGAGRRWVCRGGGSRAPAASRGRGPPALPRLAREPPGGGGERRGEERRGGEGRERPGSAGGGGRRGRCAPRGAGEAARRVPTRPVPPGPIPSRPVPSRWPRPRCAGAP